MWHVLKKILSSQIQQSYWSKLHLLLFCKGIHFSCLYQLFILFAALNSHSHYSSPPPYHRPCMIFCGFVCVCVRGWCVIGLSCNTSPNFWLECPRLGKYVRDLVRENKLLILFVNQKICHSLSWVVWPIMHNTFSLFSPTWDRSRDF